MKYMQAYVHFFLNKNMLRVPLKAGAAVSIWILIPLVVMLTACSSSAGSMLDCCFSSRLQFHSCLQLEWQNMILAKGKERRKASMYLNSSPQAPKVCITMLNAHLFSSRKKLWFLIYFSRFLFLHIYLYIVPWL